MADAIARDPYGKLLGVVTEFVKAKNIEEMEAMVVELCVILAIHLDSMDIMIEGDCFKCS